MICMSCPERFGTTNDLSILPQMNWGKNDLCAQMNFAMRYAVHMNWTGNTNDLYVLSQTVWAPNELCVETQMIWIEWGI